MSQELIEKIIVGHEGFNRGDLSEARANVADDVERGTSGTWPGLEPVYRGPEALDEWMEVLHAEWERFEVSLEEVVRDDGDAVVVAERLSGRGRESGVEVEMRVFSVYRLEAGKITRRLSFRTREEALAAL